MASDRIISFHMQPMEPRAELTNTRAEIILLNWGPEERVERLGGVLRRRLVVGEGGQAQVPHHRHSQDPGRKAPKVPDPGKRRKSREQDVGAEEAVLRARALRKGTIHD